MDGVAIIRSLLIGYAPLAAIVGDQVYAGTVPLSATFPAVGVKEVGRMEQDTAARSGPTTLVTARIQVTVYGTSYAQQKALILAANLGPGVHTGEIAGATVRSVLRDAVGPDMSDDANEYYEQARDFKVAYLEPN